MQVSFGFALSSSFTFKQLQNDFRYRNMNKLKPGYFISDFTKGFYNNWVFLHANGRESPQCQDCMYSSSQESL